VNRDRALPHRAVPELDEEAAHRCAGGVRTGHKRGSTASRCAGVEETAEGLVGGGQERDRTVEEPLVRDLQADKRCSRAALDFVATTDVGRLVPAPFEEDARSEASERELLERRE
jgi:hypothetical protein